MSLYITSLNSGSNGNCYYVGNDTEAILVDVGISCREVEKRMQRLQLSLQKVKAIFVSHEHSDHIRGIPVLSTKYQLPVYGTKSTLRNCSFTLDPSLVRHFKSDQTEQVGEITVMPFRKVHDAIEPHSFMIRYKGINVGVFTDLGIACNNLTTHFSQCHAAFLEANYDEEMLDRGHYPYYLKQRIRGGQGHLSNKQALDCFRSYRSSHLSHLILSHLSKQNNCPQLAYQTFATYAAHTEIVVASRFAETPVFKIDGTPLFRPIPIALPQMLGTQQMSLFD
jgi:phosphoribosyl 1,2-cyclic phosphodiesterase